MTDQTYRESINFVVGEEKRLEEILSPAEIITLLDSAVRAGAGRVAVAGDKAEIIWSSGEISDRDEAEIRRPLRIEGEPLNSLVVFGDPGERERLEAISTLLQDSLQLMIDSNLKRLMTTELHTTVVNQSYGELLESHEKLAASEARYRNLAEDLEKIVEKRTAELKQAHAMLLQQEKMAAVGQLAAGMAHEINNPMGFIISNLNTLKKYTGRFQEMLADYRVAAAREGAGFTSRAAQLEEKWKKLNLDLILADLEELFHQTLGGCDRIKKIVADLKGFSHIDEGEAAVVDLNEEIDRTLAVLAHQTPPDSEIRRNYAELPGFRCNPALICQAFYCIIINAFQARPEGLRLEIDTLAQEKGIILRFTDNGPGIPANIISRIFDPFFTTREVGAGTGMGLATAYEIIHGVGGTIEAASEQGQGAVFTITLPRARN
jgi:hypothetical protein